MKISVLTDNNSMSCSMQPEHGLSIHLQTNHQSFLLDTGPSGRFIQHAIQMGIDLSLTDYVFLSHGHNDHTGGLYDFLRVNKKARIIVSNDALTGQFFSTRNERKFIGNSNNFNHDTHRFVSDVTTLASKGIHILSINDYLYPTPKANMTLTKIENKVESADNFSHELVFALEAEDKLFAFTGCSHKGILNILTTVKQQFGKAPDIAIGGFHLPDGDFETEDEITNLALQLKTMFPDTRLFTGHCTGEKAYTILQHKLGSQLQLFYTGLSVEL